jgi:adenylate cyclase
MTTASGGRDGGPPQAAGSDARVTAEQQQRAKGALLAHMRHELRTPVNAILGYSEMLMEDEAEGSEALTDLQKIQAAGHTLLSLINEILDPAKIEAQGERADLEAFGSRIRHDLRTPVNTVIGYSEMLIEDVEGLSPAFKGDVERIRSAGQRLLTLIDDIVQLSGGAEGGTENAHVSGMIQNVVETIRVLEDQDRAPVEVGGRILVVDDNEINRDMLSRRLERQGYEPFCAENGRRALEMLRAEPFDVVLLDILMPEMNGYQVLERLKGDRALRDIPVIMISALDEIDSVVRCIEIGAEDFLPKPFNPVLLKARLGACLEKKRLRDREALYLKQIEEEKKRADDLLHVILPDDVVAELKSTNAVKPRRYEDVAVLFSDIVGFTPWSANREPEEILENLQMLFMAYEELAAKWSMYKIKTIGDAFMSTAGLVIPCENPVYNAVSCALEMATTARELPAGWEVRVGIHAGPVMAGVAGRKQYLYDLWGDTVNTASRVESHGVKGAVCVSASSWARVDHLFRGESRGIIAVKGKGEMEIVRVDGPRERTPRKP